MLCAFAFFADVPAEAMPSFHSRNAGKRRKTARWHVLQKHGREVYLMAGHRHGGRTRQLTGTFGTTEIAVPRARLAQPHGGTTEWKSQVLRAYQRRTLAADALIASAYLAGTNTRRVRRALATLFRSAVSKDIASRVWRKVKSDWDAWNARSLVAEPMARWCGCGSTARRRRSRCSSSSACVRMARKSCWRSGASAGRRLTRTDPHRGDRAQQGNKGKEYRHPSRPAPWSTGPARAQSFRRPHQEAFRLRPPGTKGNLFHQAGDHAHGRPQDLGRQRQRGAVTGTA